MNNKFKKSILTSVAIVGIALSYNVFFGNALIGADEKIDYSSSAQEFSQKFCNFNNLSTEEIKVKFLDSTNRFFNNQIKEVMKAEKKRTENAAKLGVEQIGSFNNDEESVDRLNTPPLIEDFEKSKYKDLCKNGSENRLCKMLVLCKGNTTTYCTAINIMGFSPRYAGEYDSEVLDKSFGTLKNSFWCYKYALEAKKSDIKELNPNGSSDQIYSVSELAFERSNQIDLEVQKSKAAIDETLDAYSQLLRTWRMHKRYIKIFESLVEYRDYLVDVRKQTDSFPMKFIDASTTKCL